jgi:hypothetical protein
LLVAVKEVVQVVMKLVLVVALVAIEILTTLKHLEVTPLQNLK